MTIRFAPGIRASRAPAWAWTSGMSTSPVTIRVGALISPSRPMTSGPSLIIREAPKLPGWAVRSATTKARWASASGVRM